MSTDKPKQLMEPTMALVFRVLSYNPNNKGKNVYKPQVQYVDLTIGDEPAHIVKLP